MAWFYAHCDKIMTWPNAFSARLYKETPQRVWEVLKDERERTYQFGIKVASRPGTMIKA
jgi:hypothetical protein